MTLYREKNIEDDSPQFETMLKTSIDSTLRHTWTALPGIVKSFDPGTQTAEIRAAIQQGYYDENNELKYREQPLLVNVPVHFVCGGGVCITHNLVAGDAGIIIFSARCIDSWYQSGGVQIPENTRKHSFSDGMFIPGIRALTDKIESFETSGMEIRTESRSMIINVSEDGIKMGASGSDFKKLVNEEFKDLYNTHFHPGGSGPPDVTKQITDTQLTDNTEAN